MSLQQSPCDTLLQFPYNDVTARAHNLPTDFAFCSKFVEKKRDTLMLELHNLGGMSWKIKPSDIATLLGKQRGT
jgi:hypothetical protein